MTAGPHRRSPSSSSSSLLFLIAAIKVAREYERGIIFRLGRLLPEPKGPGLFLLIPIVDRMVKVDLRTITLNIPPQEVITKDNVPVRVNAVAYFRIVEPKDAIVQIENFMVATSQIAQTTLRSVLGQHVLDELLSEREKINAILQEIIDEATEPWGIKVSIVEVKDVEIPQGMQRAMARQAEAERERRAKVINAEGEFQAAERLKDAAVVIEEHPIALQLRYLQTLLEIGARSTTTIVFPAPIDLIRPFLDRAADLRADPLSGRLRGRSRRAGTAARRRARADRGSRRRRARGCPFCAGREERTPPETFRFGDGGGWTVRVVPNLYPAFERQEVVVHSPRHVRTFAELTDGRSTAVAEAWQRARAKRSGDCFHAALNEGATAGLEPAALALAARVAARAPPETSRRARAAGADELSGTATTWLPGREPRAVRARAPRRREPRDGEPPRADLLAPALRSCATRAAAAGPARPRAVERVAARGPTGTSSSCRAERLRRDRARRGDLRQHRGARRRRGSAASV